MCILSALGLMCRVGQNHIYIYIQYFWLGDRQIYGHIRCLYTILANPTYVYPVQTVVGLKIECTCLAYVYYSRRV